MFLNIFVIEHKYTFCWKHHCFKTIQIFGIAARWQKSRDKLTIRSNRMKLLLTLILYTPNTGIVSPVFFSPYFPQQSSTTITIDHGEVISIDIIFSRIIYLHFTPFLLPFETETPYPGSMGKTKRWCVYLKANKWEDGEEE